MKALILNLTIGLFLLLTTVYAINFLPPDLMSASGPQAIVVAAVLYFLSQVLRGIRLMVLAIPTLDVSGRTTFLLQFYTAAVAMALPFKLGELFRIQQLAAISKKPVAAVIIIIVERTFDAVCLLAICLWLRLGEGVTSDKLSTLIVLATAVSCFAILAFVFAPQGLGWLQRYIVLRHINWRARLLLALIDRLRRASQVGHTCFKRSGFLLFVSALIWGAEVLAMSMLLPSGTGGVANAAIASIERVGSEWRWISGLSATMPTEPQASFITFLILVIVWPPVAIAYRRRLAAPKLEGQHRTSGEFV